MSTTTSKVDKSEIKKAAKKVGSSPFLETITRLGFGVRGAIYIIIGVLAIQLVIGQGGQLASPLEAIARIGEQPTGKLLLWVVLLGLVSYSLWGLVRAILDPLHKGHDLNGLMARLGYLVSAFGYAVLVPPTLGYIAGLSQSNGSSQGMITWLMAIPIGRWVVGLAGLAGVVGGLYQIYLGLKPHFERQFQIYDFTPEQAKLAINVARFGTVSRGVVFAVLGAAIAIGAYNADPTQQITFDAGLAALLELPFGTWVLGIVAVGLIAFGTYSVLSMIWFRLKRSGGDQ